MTSIESVTVEVADPRAAEQFYSAAFGLGSGGQVRIRASDAPTTGFRGFALSLIVSQPSTIRSLFDSAIAAGATMLKPVEKSLWGYGGVVRAPDGSIWKVATSAKKDAAGVSRDGTGSHRLVICSDAGTFADPDGFVWESAPA
ncbi:MAG: hypothetical protein QOH44_1712 [Actinomycetota bacterium]|jgi:predicted lactoylglutathione lyase|nr:hypothetical protein [Actinomycetota bacterium]